MAQSHETHERCETCTAMTTQDGLAMPTLEIVSTHVNTCAPINHYECRCRICGTRWDATEVYDDHGATPSTWTWQLREPADPSPPG